MALRQLEPAAPYRSTPASSQMMAFSGNLEDSPDGLVPKPAPGHDASLLPSCPRSNKRSLWSSHRRARPGGEQPLLRKQLLYWQTIPVSVLRTLHSVTPDSRG